MAAQLAADGYSLLLLGNTSLALEVPTLCDGSSERAKTFQDTESACKQANSAITVVSRACDCGEESAVQAAVAEFAAAGWYFDIPRMFEAVRLAGRVDLLVHCISSFRPEAAIGSADLLGGFDFTFFFGI